MNEPGSVREGMRLRFLKQYEFYRGTTKNLLTVTGYVRDGVNWKFECTCECGNKTKLTHCNYANGITRSCGCLLGNHRRVPRGMAAANNVYLGYRRAAQLRQYKFDLTRDEFLKMTQEPCFYCGNGPLSTMASRGKNGDFKYNGIDRKDNSAGYIDGNCVPCCSICNKIKLDHDIKFLTVHMRKMLNHMESKNGD